jgi:hypothetical protein
MADKHYHKKIFEEQNIILNINIIENYNSSFGFVSNHSNNYKIIDDDYEIINNDKKYSKIYTSKYLIIKPKILNSM